MNKKQPVVVPPVVNLERYEEFKVKISQLVPFDLNFGNMTLTEYELLVMTIYRLNELIGIVNMYSTTIDEVLEWVIGDGLAQSVLVQLNEWLVDGTLEVLINEALFNSKLDKVDFEEFKSEYELYKTEQGNVNLGVEDYLDSLNDLKLDKTVYNDYTESIDNNISLINERINDSNRYHELVHQLIYGDTNRNFMHRGLSHYFPENSMWAFDMAGFTGAKGLEIDLWKSNDDVFIISHDDSLLSMTDSNLNISQSSSNFILNQNITKGNGVTRVPNTKMLRFQTAIDIALKYDMKIIAEIKPTDLNHTALQKLIDILISKNCLDRVALMCFDFGTLERLRSLNTSVVLGYVMGTNTFNSETIDSLKILGNSFASVNFDTQTKAISQQRLADINNIPITFWTINDVPTSQALFMNGIKSITSDRIKGSTPKMVTKAFMLNKVDGVVSVNRDWMPEFATTWSDNPNILMLVYLSPFVVNDSDANASIRRTVVQVAMSGSNDLNYTIRASGERNNQVELQLFDPTGSRVPFSNLPNGYFFNVTVTGWDFL